MDGTVTDPKVPKSPTLSVIFEKGRPRDKKYKVNTIEGVVFSSNINRSFSRFMS